MCYCYRNFQIHEFLRSGPLDGPLLFSSLPFYPLTFSLQAMQICIFSILGVMGRVTGPHGPSDWETAKAACESKGLKLMTIDSQEEENYVNDVLQPTNA